MFNTLAYLIFIVYCFKIVKTDRHLCTFILTILGVNKIFLLKGYHGLKLFGNHSTSSCPIIQMFCHPLIIV